MNCEMALMSDDGWMNGYFSNLYEYFRYRQLLTSITTFSTWQKVLINSGMKGNLFVNRIYYPIERFKPQRMLDITSTD